MPDDAALRQDIIDELAWEPGIDAAHIGVAVSDGIVTLTGHVKSHIEKTGAEHVVSRVKGVRGIAEELTVNLRQDDPRTDEEIAHSIVNVLRWYAGIPLGAIEVVVEHGHVTLTGKVKWQYQKDIAGRAASRIRGVRGVDNQVGIDPGVAPDEVEQRIRDALKRSAELDAGHIKVTAEGGHVTLTGHASTWHERKLAEQAAWSAPGVMQVTDEITLLV